MTSEVGAAKGKAGWVLTGLSDEAGDGVDLGPKGFTGDVCAHSYVVGSCDGGLPTSRAGTTWS